LILNTIEEKLKEKGIDIDFNNVDIEVVKGADEIDLVYSALDNIISKSLEKIYEFSTQRGVNLR